MASSANPSTNTINSNPLQDDDLSELTKKEILFWARKLNLSPTDLFTLSKQELEHHLERAQREELYAEQRKSQYDRWEKLTEMKRFLLEEDQKERLKGGETPNRRTIWDILCAAANEIESLYGNSQQLSNSIDSTLYPYSNPDSLNYESSSFGGLKMSHAPKMCSTIYKMHPEDSHYTPPHFPSTLCATPINYSSGQRRNAIISPPLNATHNIRAANVSYGTNAPRNATYKVQRKEVPSNANGTYNVCPSRFAKFDMPRSGNATFNIAPSQNVTYNVPHNQNATYDVCRNAPNATYNLKQSKANAKYNIPQHGTTYTTHNAPANAMFSAAIDRNQTFNVAPSREHSNVTFKVPDRSSGTSSCFRPNSAKASTPKNCARTNQKDYFRNYTDYSMTFTDLGITEASQSVTYDVFSDKKSMVRAAARTYSFPHRSKSCPPSGRTNRYPHKERSSSSMPCSRGISRTRSAVRSATPEQAATIHGYSKLKQPSSRDRTHDEPRRLFQVRSDGFCDCDVRRSRKR